MAQKMASSGSKRPFLSLIFLRNPLQVSLVKSPKTMDKQQLSTAGFDKLSIESVQLSESVLTFSTTLSIDFRFARTHHFLLRAGLL